MKRTRRDEDDEGCEDGEVEIDGICTTAEMASQIAESYSAVRKLFTKKLSTFGGSVIIYGKGFGKHSEVLRTMTE